MSHDQDNKPRKKALWIAITLGAGCLAMAVCVSIAVLGYVLISAGGSSSADGESFAPAWSPDGAWIAFFSTRDGGDDIYIMQSDGANVARLTTRSGFSLFFRYSRYPKWSPDGGQIAFVSNRSGHDEIYVIDRDGSQVRQLTDSPAEGRESSGEFGAFDWSPDGQQIVFLMTKGKISYTETNAPQPTQDIYVVNVDGTQLTRLTDLEGFIELAQWSPDGSRILFTFAEQQADDPNSPFPPYAMYEMNADGTNLTRLTNTGGAYWQTRWSPDGKKIAFVFDNGQPDLYVMEADGAQLTQLTDDEAREDELFWSPDGTRIAFTSGDLFQHNLYIVNAAGTGFKRLTYTSGIGESAPSWSPDGTRLAFDTNDPQSRVNNIFIIDADGSNLIQLTGN